MSKHRDYCATAMFVFEPSESKIKKLPDLFLSGKGQKQPAEAVF